ncbi:DegV family protein [Thermosyntropha sp.]|uniref:DegV family protein n=1 Tax=Thermosyntropha sp. TaxID=2740820 RepID=UPI0025E29980|nr:DegV family protein [Thermosyntropha sp.]MBO8158725.1 DegV family protein [Thermosyntropha sp.]
MKLIITDSTASLPPGFAEKNNVVIVPLKVNIEDKSLREGIDISNREYYRLLRSKPIFPQTSQPAAGDFLDIFRTLKPGDEALAILISSQISGTVQAATIAKDMLKNNKARIEIFDSLSTVVGLGFQVMKACELVKEDFPLDKIIEELKLIRHKTKILFIVDNLEYLARGGRISHAVKTLGNLLQIKPVLSIIQTGKIEVYDKVRTKKKAVKKIIEEFKKEADTAELLSVVHVDNPQEAEEIYKEIRNFYSGPSIITEPGPVIGSHVGPGAVGLAWH